MAKTKDGRFPRAATEGRGGRPVRRTLWLVVGVVIGLALGFAYGLAKPRVRSR